MNYDFRADHSSFDQTRKLSGLDSTVFHDIAESDHLDQTVHTRGILAGLGQVHEALTPASSSDIEMVEGGQQTGLMDPSSSRAMDPNATLPRASNRASRQASGSKDNSQAEPQLKMRQEMSFYPLNQRGSKQNASPHGTLNNTLGPSMLKNIHQDSISPGKVGSGPRTPQMTDLSHVQNDQLSTVVAEERRNNQAVTGALMRQHNRLIGDPHQGLPTLEEAKQRQVSIRPEVAGTVSLRQQPSAELVQESPLKSRLEQASPSKSREASPGGDSLLQQIERSDPNSEVFSWGCDSSGQLGLGDLHGEKHEANGGGIDMFNMPQPRFCVYGITIKQVACGDEHSAFLTTQHHIYTMGSNRCGQLGIRDKEVQQKSSPVLVEQMVGHRTIDISCGGAHTLVATDRGEAFSWGEGRYGALGIADCVTDEFRPQKVIFKENASSYKKEVTVKQVSAGYRHSAFLDEHGRVFTCGNNELGQLGVATRSSLLLPLQIDAFEEVATQVSCGQHHTLLLTEKGAVYAFGSNKQNQLGVKTEHDSCLRPQLVSEIAHIPMCQVSAGSFSAAISKEKGSVYLWGHGTFGQFAVPHRMKRIKQAAMQVSVGNQFGLVLTNERQVYNWGVNNCGQLGSNDFFDRPGPQLMPKITSEGRMIKQVAAGGMHSLCIGTSTGLTIMDEQRMALEAKISDLESKKTSKDVRIQESTTKSRKDQFRQALKESRSMSNKRDSGLTIAKSQSSILKKSFDKSIKKSRKKSADMKDRRSAPRAAASKSISKSRDAHARKSADRVRQISPLVSKTRRQPQKKEERKEVESSKIMRASIIDTASIYGADPSGKKKMGKRAVSKTKKKVSLKKRRDFSANQSNLGSTLQLVSRSASRKKSEPRLEKKKRSSTNSKVSSSFKMPVIKALAPAMVDRSQAMSPMVSKQASQRASNRDNSRASRGKSKDEGSVDLHHVTSTIQSANMPAKSVQTSTIKAEPMNPFKRDEGLQMNIQTVSAQEASLVASNAPSTRLRVDGQRSTRLEQQVQEMQPDELIGTQGETEQRVGSGLGYHVPHARSTFGHPSIDATLHPGDLSRENSQLENTQSGVGANITGFHNQIQGFGSQSMHSEAPISAYEGGDKSFRDPRAQLEMTRIQTELKHAHQRLQLTQSEKTTMASELQNLRERDQMNVQEIMMRDQRIASLENELQQTRHDRHIVQEECSRERARANELDMALTTTNFKVQDVSQQLETQTMIARSAAALKEENMRLAQAETELHMARNHVQEVDQVSRGLRATIQSLEAQLIQVRGESSEKDAAIRQIDLDVQDIQGQLEAQEKAKALLQAENDGLRRDIETLQCQEERARQLKTQFENERQMRINAEADIARMREQLADEAGNALKEQENLRRALDTMRYNHEEAIRQINVKNEEIETMMSNMENLSTIIETREHEIADHKSTIVQLEMKNRKLNETVNKTIYEQTQKNIDGTMDVLKRRGTNENPERLRKVRDMGIEPQSDLRLTKMLSKERDSLPNAVALRDAGNRKAREMEVTFDVMNDPSKSQAPVIGKLENMRYDGSEYMFPYQKNEDFLGHLPHAHAPGNDMTPLQADFRAGYIDHENWQTPGSANLYPGREADLDNLYLPNLANGAAGARHPPGPEVEDVKLPTEEEVIANRAQTQMTSNMIKSSLAELKGKLNDMKNNKRVVSQGMQLMDNQAQRDRDHHEQLRRNMDLVNERDYKL